MPTKQAFSMDFEDLILQQHYIAGDQFTASDMPITVMGVGATKSTPPFRPPLGKGYVSVQANTNAGGAGKELFVKNALLKFDLGGTVNRVEFCYGEQKSSLVLMVNSVQQFYKDFDRVNGTKIDGVTVSVINPIDHC